MVELANTYRVKLATLTPPKISVGQSLAPPRTLVVAIRGLDGVPGPEGPNIEPYTYTAAGPLFVGTGAARVYLDSNYTLETVRIAVGSAPVGLDSIIVDVNKNGLTIYTDQNNRPFLAESQVTATGNAATGTVFAPGDYMTIDVDSVGSAASGADLTVTVRLRKTS